MDMDLHDEIEHSLGAEPRWWRPTWSVGDGERCGGVVSRRVGRWSRSPRSPLVAAAIATHRPAAQVAPAPAAAGPTVGTTNEPSFPPRRALP